MNFLESKLLRCLPFKIFNRFFEEYDWYHSLPSLSAFEKNITEHGSAQDASEPHVLATSLSKVRNQNQMVKRQLVHIAYTLKD